MSVPVLTFFNNKGGVGKTSLVFHLAWMFAEMGKRVVAVDLDPQANLTSAFLSEDALEELWDPQVPPRGGTTIYRCIEPLTKVGDIETPIMKKINPRLHLVPGDLALAGFEDQLSGAWTEAMGSNQNNLYRPFRLLTAFWQVAQMAATESQADLILADVGPNLGAINRSALISSDYVVIPLAADLFSLQGLRNLGPTLVAWRSDWTKRLANWEQPAFALPTGAMNPSGYILMQHMERLSRPVKAYKKWVDRIPGTYRESVLRLPAGTQGKANDGNCLARLKHYRSLVPMAQEVHKPIFHLSSADGAIGSHSQAVHDAWSDFKALAVAIDDRIHLGQINDI
ncbi:MAG: AAA family ATPase [Burkholderiaceae bacterium]|nr:AAA family ATPase [Burkholderiaceae bacterium]MDZ4144210.1 AAA family ATPase [Burkholderiales bacterium]